MENDSTSRSGDLNRKYVGFWHRSLASLVDGVLLGVVTAPWLYSVYGEQLFVSERLFLGTTDVMLRFILPFVVTLLFWIYRAATPGKILISAKIIDAKTGLPPTKIQYVVRYFGYFVSSIPFGLGLLWVALDDKKQGWHDKLAGTYVIYTNQYVDKDISIFEG
ncbi:RDD family protein [Veronia pacifica]|uniref:RDD domain-containing protein n=1 Tax=Veronia pacifica TaxID=1080227 RepID=A0A1C3EKU6_9GAMM|nr:RDD family protein [Veronia pacifica]ODA33856.1 hypothetical protein A8L45_08490 [Veronia pacifica]